MKDAGAKTGSGGNAISADPRTYIAIDLKSFYASVECRERKLDPLDTNLVVADLSRTEKTICLAVSPSLKSYGIPGRARLFEVVQRVKEVNAARKRGTERKDAPAFSRKAAAEETKSVHSAGPEPVGTGGGSAHRSVSAAALAADPSLEVDYVVAPPRMSLYMEYSARIYNIYMKYVAPEDVHVYSVDEVFIDATRYLELYGISAHDLARRMIRDVLSQTGITATAGIGTNLYLAKVAMDVEAKHVEADADGVRIAELDERSYRQKLWCHRPLTDFWRVGRGYARKLEAHGICTMGDVARCSVQDEDLLYSLFGVNAELLIDHAWGWEPCTIGLIKAYEPEDRSFSHGQVLQCPYDFEKARVVVHEMADAAALDLVEKGMTTNQLVLTVGYDIENLARIEKLREEDRERGAGSAAIAITQDRYGRKMPKHAHGTSNLKRRTNASPIIDEAVLELYDRIVDPRLLVRRMYLSVNHVRREERDARPGAQGGAFMEKQKAEKQKKERRKKNTAGGAAEMSGGTGNEPLSQWQPHSKPQKDQNPVEPAGTWEQKDQNPVEPAGTWEQMDLNQAEPAGSWEQMDLFTDYEALEAQQEAEKERLDKERRLQEAMLSIRGKYGKNAILKGINFKEGATGRERNALIGGHREA